MALKTFLFDLGNVLVHFSHERMCGQLADASGLPHDRMQAMLFQGGLQQRFETGAISRREFHGFVQSEAGKYVDFDILCRAGADIFELNAPVLPVLDQLKSAGYRLVLLSNTCESHFDWVRSQWDLLDRFDDFVLSYEVGAAKPDPAIFKAALAKIDCPPEECFYTDDIAAYVEQGRAHRLDAELFTDVPALIAQLANRGMDIRI